ncbi:hypothetical protein EFN17_01280 [Propionibacterium freudenreichii]|nr:hypothetical protein [Propionibacterium freudenreichii]
MIVGVTNNAGAVRPMLPSRLRALIESHRAPEGGARDDVTHALTWTPERGFGHQRDEGTQVQFIYANDNVIMKTMFAGTPMTEKATSRGLAMVNNWNSVPRIGRAFVWFVPPRRVITAAGLRSTITVRGGISDEQLDHWMDRTLLDVNEFADWVDAFARGKAPRHRRR